MSNGMRSSTQDYMFALEGVSYAQVILRNHSKELNDMIMDLNKPDVMGGETGREYCKRLQEAVSVIDAVVVKFDKFAANIQELCHENGAFLEGTVMDNFNECQKRFAAKASEIKDSKIKG